MAKQITIDEPVIFDNIQGNGFALLTAKLNNKTVGIPILTDMSNAMTLVQPTVNLRLVGSTTYKLDGKDIEAYMTLEVPDHPSAPMGVAVRVGKTTYAIPLYTVPQNSSDVTTIEFNEVTFAAGMQPTSIAENAKREYPVGESTKVLIFSIDDQNFGIPLFDFTHTVDIGTGEWKEITEEERNNVNPMPPIPTVMDGANGGDVVKKRCCMPLPRVTTMISVGKPTVDFGSEYGSTYLNNKITAYSDLINRIKMQFGWPSVELDLCDENIAEFIDQAMELYSKYAGFNEEFLVFDSRIYKRGTGIRLDKLFSITPELLARGLEGNKVDFDYDIQNYRKVLNVSSVQPGESTGINTLFTLEQAMAQQTYFSFLLGSYGWDLITWNCVKNWLDVREKVLAQQVYFRFNPQTQYLRLTPEPLPGQGYLGLVSCYVEKPIRELINEAWIFEYAMALTLVAIGRLRSKYSFQMLGGATITGDQLLSQGMEKKKELEEMLFKGQGWVSSEYAQPMFYVG